MKHLLLLLLLLLERGVWPSYNDNAHQRLTERPSSSGSVPPLFSVDIGEYYHLSDPPSLTGKGVRLFVLDSGVGEYYQSWSGVSCWSAVPQCTCADKGHSHGSEIVSLLKGWNESGTSVKGMAPAAVVEVIRIFDPDLNTNYSILYTALEYLWETVRRVETTSPSVLLFAFGHLLEPAETVGVMREEHLRLQCVRLLRRIVSLNERHPSQSVTLVASAGNAGPLLGTLLTPFIEEESLWKDILVVGSVQYGAEKLVSFFSSRGPIPTSNPQRPCKPDLVALGEHIRVLSSDETNTPRKVVARHGTSYAAAVVASFVALLYDHLLQTVPPPRPTSLRWDRVIHQALLETATPLPNPHRLAAMDSCLAQGAGEVHFHRAVKRVEAIGSRGDSMEWSVYPSHLTNHPSPLSVGHHGGGQRGYYHLTERPRGWTSYRHRLQLLGPTKGVPHLSIRDDYVIKLTDVSLLNSETVFEREGEKRKHSETSLAPFVSFISFDLTVNENAEEVVVDVGITPVAQHYWETHKDSVQSVILSGTLTFFYQHHLNQEVDSGGVLDTFEENYYTTVFFSFRLIPTPPSNERLGIVMLHTDEIPFRYFFDFLKGERRYHLELLEMDREERGCEYLASVAAVVVVWNPSKESIMQTNLLERLQRCPVYRAVLLLNPFETDTMGNNNHKRLNEFLKNFTTVYSKKEQNKKVSLQISKLYSKGRLRDTLDTTRLWMSSYQHFPLFTFSEEPVENSDSIPNERETVQVSLCTSSSLISPENHTSEHGMAGWLQSSSSSTTPPSKTLFFLSNSNCLSQCRPSIREQEWLQIFALYETGRAYSGNAVVNGLPFCFELISEMIVAMKSPNQSSLVDSFKDRFEFQCKERS